MRKRFRRFLVKAGYYSYPDFIIIGAQKAGTLSLFTILNQHSKLKGSIRKEIHYFDNDQWYLQGKLYQYHSFFPLPIDVPQGGKLFEATPIYLFHPEVAYRLHKYNPKLKLIVLLREPSAIAFSAWTMYHNRFKTGVFKNLYDPRTFSEAVADELDNLEQTSFYDNKAAYVKRGIYYYQLENYYKYFNVDQILIIENNELKENFDNTISKISSFLNIPNEKLKLLELNKSEVNEKIKYIEDIQKLKEFYKPSNRKLFQLIGKEFNWD